MELEPTSNHTRDILDWHRKNGGHNDRPAGVALILLGEAVELAIKAGATPTEIKAAIGTELIKARDRHEDTGFFQATSVGEECADVGILLLLFSKLNNIPLADEIEEKLIVLNHREYEPNSWGALTRKRTPR